MFGIERLQAIRELVKEKKSVEVTYLSKELSVSEVTIRRDLDKLEKEGFVAKTYGGAILMESNPEVGEQRVVQVPLTKNSAKTPYDRVAFTAAELIENGDTLFIPGGMMGMALAKCLEDLQDLIVITNNLEIAMYLYQLGGHKVVMLGGEIDGQTGNVQEFDQLEELLIEKSFIAVEGVDQQFGYTVNDRHDVRLYKRLKACSRQLILVTVTDVYNKRGLVKLAPLDAIETIVGEKTLPDAFKGYYYENNIRVHTTMLRKD